MHREEFANQDCAEGHDLEYFWEVQSGSVNCRLRRRAEDECVWIWKAWKASMIGTLSLDRRTTQIQVAEGLSV